MNKKRIALFSCAALVAAGIGLNIQNALADYGIGENSLSLVAVGTGGSGTGSSGSSSTPGGYSEYVYVIVDNEQCYKIEKSLISSVVKQTKDNEGYDIKYRESKYKQEVKYSKSQKTEKVKWYDTKWRKQSLIAFCQTCSDLGLSSGTPTEPVADEVTEIEYLD